MRPSACALALAALAGPMLEAHEVSLLLSRQMGKAQAADAALFGQSKGSFEAGSAAGQGLRLGYSLLDLKLVEISATGTVHRQAEARVELAGRDTGLDYRARYVALGAQVDWKLLVNVSVGLEVRQERLEMGAERVQQSRPWLRAGFGFSIPTPALSPFVRLEVAVPTVKEGRTTTASELVKALAPQVQVAACGGIRF